MTEGTSKLYKQCIFQLFKRDSLLVFIANCTHLDAQITLLYIPPHSCPRLSLLYPFHPCFCRFWAAQIPIYRICSTKKFLSVQEILQYDSLADCLKAICHPSQRAERLRSVEETRPRSGSRAASIARSRSAQVN